MERRCDRKGCDRAAFARVNQRLWYCAFHNKLQGIKETARRRGKTVPTSSDLEALFLAAKRCASCKAAIDAFKVFRRRESRDEMATLQHNADGSLSVFCLRCNVIEGCSRIGEAALRVPSDQRTCLSCRSVKSVSDFHPSRNPRRPGVFYYASNCKPCAAAVRRNRMAGLGDGKKRI